MQVIERHGFDVVTSPCKRGQHIEQRPAVDQGEIIFKPAGAQPGCHDTLCVMRDFHITAELD